MSAPAGRLATHANQEIAASLPSEEVLRRLQDHVSPDTTMGGILWDTSDRGYVGTFEGHTFRIRIARRTPQFYATYLFGRVEQRPAGSAVLVHFGHRGYATAALWILRVVGALLVGAMLLAAIQQMVFLFFAVFIAVGVASLLWLYRLRGDDVARLHSLVVAAIR